MARVKTPWWVPYIAGMVDGDGTIDVHRNVDRIRPMIQVVNQSEELMSFLAVRGGGIQKHGHPCEDDCARKHAHSRRQSHFWRNSGTRALIIIECLLLYLVIKQDRAKTVLEEFETYRRYATIRVDMIERGWPVEGP